MPERPPGAPPIPSTTLQELGEGWVFDVRCERCRNRVRLAANRLESTVGGQTRIWEVTERLRCHSFIDSVGDARCGGRPGTITLSQLRQRGSMSVAGRGIPVLDRRGGGK